MLRFLFIFLGTITLGLGFLGIVTPGLPATPFFLLTAALYLRSSDKLYNKLINNKVAGKYIHDFYSKKGMTRKTKVWSITLMWVMITLSCLFLVSSLPVIITILAAGIAGTVVMGFSVPTVRP